MLTDQHTRPSIKAVLESHGAVVSERSGWQPIRCPYHGDTHASASVNLAHGAFHCHACGIKGDAYSLIQQHEGCDFATALTIGDGLAADNRNPAPTRKRKGKGKRTAVRGLWG
jgi:DNA primase